MPILAKLSALGSIASVASSVYNIIKNSRKQCNDSYLNAPIRKGFGKGFLMKKVL